MSLTIELKPAEEQIGFNLERWTELLSDPELAKLDYRIETDRYGHILMSPPPAPLHGYRQAKIARLLKESLPNGEIISECPVSTSDGVKAIDVAWLRSERVDEIRGLCLSRAPELCVEIFSPSNGLEEMLEKRALYFEAGAQEVWFCQLDGSMTFGLRDRDIERSRLCPDFPTAMGE
jgi:Uma2 family endonuclease